MKARSPSAPSTPPSSPSFSFALTALDHLILPAYLGSILTFDLRDKDRNEILNRLELAIAKLLAHFPFLAGYIVPAPNTDGKINAFEVRCDVKDTTPFFQVQYLRPSDALLIDGRLNPLFSPIPEPIDPSRPCPVMRLQAVIQEDILYLISCHHHMVADGLGMNTVGAALAQLLREPESPASALPTTAAAQQEMREHLANLATTSKPEGIRWDLKPIHFPLLGLEDRQYKTSTVRYPIRKDKIRLLQQACRTLMQGSPLKVQDKSFPSTSLIIGSLFAICTQRAHYAAGLGNLYGARFGVAVNLREKLGLLHSYMGNAVVTTNIAFNTQVLPFTCASAEPLGSGVRGVDVYQVCNLALAIIQEMQAYTKSHVAGILATLTAATDRSSVRVPFEGLAFSDLHKMNFYRDYGPLGVVQDMAMPGSDIGGFAWLLPRKPGASGKGAVDHIELQVCLERVSIDELERDSLFQWVTGDASTMSKL